MAKIVLINGPNLNLLGKREPHWYGCSSLDTIEQEAKELAQKSAHFCDCFQTNAEHTIVDRIQTCLSDGTAFLIINAGAYSHTSIAIRDALAAVQIPYIEVHLSNVYAREPFRHASMLSSQAKGVICGFGAMGYSFAMQYACKILAQQ